MVNIREHKLESLPSGGPTLFLLFLLNSLFLSPAYSSQITKTAPAHAIVKGHLGEFGNGDYVEFRNQAGRRTGVGKAYRTTGRNTYFEVFSGSAPKGTRPYRSDDLNRIYGEGTYLSPEERATQKEASQRKRPKLALMLMAGGLRGQRNFLNLTQDNSEQTGFAYGAHLRIGKSRTTGGLALRLGVKRATTPFRSESSQVDLTAYTAGIEYSLNLSSGAKIGLGGLVDYALYDSSEGVSAQQTHFTAAVHFLFIITQSFHWGFEYQKPFLIQENFRPHSEERLLSIFEFEF